MVETTSLRTLNTDLPALIRCKTSRKGWNSRVSRYFQSYQRKFLLKGSNLDLFGCVSGDHNNWNLQTFDLTSVPTLGDLTGQSQVWIRFHFTSNGVDFVRWGSSTMTPPAGTGWTGSNPPGPPNGQSIGRDPNGTDI